MSVGRLEQDEWLAKNVAIPVEVLAYHVVVPNGADVDQPRNLAKSEAVE